MYESDQAYRMEMQEAHSNNGPRSLKFITLWLRQEFNDWVNVRQLDNIIEESGWPHRSVVGDKAATAAFLVIQHASPNRQKEYFPFLRAAVEIGEAAADHLALLEDRILMSEGKKQRYGSQLQDNGKGGWEFYPIEDEANVDERRKAVGLPPLAEYAKTFGFEYQPIGVQQAVHGTRLRRARELQRWAPRMRHD